MSEAATESAVRSPIAMRLKRARQRKGLSRREVATDLNVNVSAVVAWEAGKYLPRDGHRVALSRLLNIALDELFDEDAGDGESRISAAFLRGSQLSDDALAAATANCAGQLNILRIAEPHGTARHHLRQFRRLAARRILEQSLALKQVEIFYNLQRLQEVLFNIVRYEGKDYHVKTFMNAVGESVFPGLDAYIFDGAEALLASYWDYGTPDERPLIRVKGEPFRNFLEDYWHEAWRRAASLNFKGSAELGLVQEIAFRLGLPRREWPKFLAGAKSLDIGDGAPPLP